MAAVGLKRFGLASCHACKKSRFPLLLLLRHVIETQVSLATVVESLQWQYSLQPPLTGDGKYTCEVASLSKTHAIIATRRLECVLLLTDPCKIKTFHSSCFIHCATFCFPHSLLHFLDSVDFFGLPVCIYKCARTCV